MQQQKKLRGRVRLEPNGSMTFLGAMHDGTQFQLTADVNDLELNDKLVEANQYVDGWLFVLQEAQQDTRCYLTLPKPTIEYGKQIVVHEFSLMPRVSSLAHFNSKITKAKKAKVAE